MATLRSFLLTADIGPTRLPILLAAFAYIPPGGRARTIEQLEVEGEIKQQLYAITTETEPNVRRYTGGDQPLSLTAGQIELLRQRILEYPFWNPLLADQVAETYRWLGLSSVVATPAAAVEA